MGRSPGRCSTRESWVWTVSGLVGRWAEGGRGGGVPSRRSAGTLPRARRSFLASSWLPRQQWASMRTGDGAEGTDDDREVILTPDQRVRVFVSSTMEELADRAGRGP